MTNEPPRRCAICGQPIRDDEDWQLPANLGDEWATHTAQATCLARWREAIEDANGE